MPHQLGAMASATTKLTQLQCHTMQPKYRVAAIESTTFERRRELSASSLHEDEAS